MHFDDRRKRDAATTRATTQAKGGIPGKQTLIERLASPVQAAVGRTDGATGASSPVPVPGRGPLPTMLQLFGGGPAADEPSQVHAAAARGTSTATSALPYFDQIQRAFGHHDVSGVKAHTGADAAASAKAMGAKAYATGDHVVLGEGTDLHTVAHEAAHVVQQRGGVQLKGGVGDLGDKYEQHADAVAGLVVQGKPADRLLDEMAPDVGLRSGPLLVNGDVGGHVQRKIDPDHKEYVNRSVFGPGGLGTIIAVMDMGYMVNFDQGTIYVPAVDLDFPKEEGSPNVPVHTPEVAHGGKLSSEKPLAEPRLAEPVQVFVKSLSGKTLTIELTPTHVADTATFYQTVTEALVKDVPGLKRAQFRITCGPRFIPRTGEWPEVPAPAKELEFKVTVEKREEVPDDALIKLVNGLEPSLVVPCSQINDTHVNDPDSKAVDPEAEVKRYVSLSNLGSQQKLSQVLEALNRRDRYTLVLIDPSFGPEGVEHQMVQIVEYLQSQGYQFSIEKRIVSHHVTIYMCDRVRIVYVGVAVNGKTIAGLPNLGSI